MKQFSIILPVATFFLVSSNAFSSTCPKPSSFKYVNGEWKAPKNWYFSSAPVGGPGDHVGNFIEVEWQKIAPNTNIGSIDWCKYNWVEYPGDELSVFWIGNPMFATINKKQYWTEISSGSMAYRCYTSLENCSFNFTNG